MSVRKSIQSVGAVAWKVGQPLKIESIKVAAPNPGEVGFKKIVFTDDTKFRSGSSWYQQVFVNRTSGSGRAVTRVSLLLFPRYLVMKVPVLWKVLARVSSWRLETT